MSRRKRNKKGEKRREGIYQEMRKREEEIYKEERGTRKKGRGWRGRKISRMKRNRQKERGGKKDIKNEEKEENE